MLSKLGKDEKSRRKGFLDWLLKTLPGIETGEWSDDAPLQPYQEVRPRLATTVINGERRDRIHDYHTHGHVELGDNLLLVTQGNLKLGERSTNPHWQLMTCVRAYYMQKRCSYRVGQSCLPVILIAYYGAFIPLVRVLACQRISGPCIDASAVIVYPGGTVQVEAPTPALRVDCDYQRVSYVGDYRR